ncbi:MAG: sodium:alanine symporter family protein, partial [Chitinophagaceae bacterium]|nr:sodium:alanine symporter family protein [Chitinophagaceae bacterium]
MNKTLRKALALIGLFAFPLISIAQDIPEKTKGLDQRINESFQPITDAWSGIVFYTVNLAGIQVPIVLILLVCGALFFTIYFGFVNIRRFGLAIEVVRGKHDDIEKDVPPVDDTNVNVVDGDIVDTIKDESKHGEVNHFQALATAVSGTVGLGNIAGVAIAIAIGGPGATFWMIVCGLLGMSSKFVECTLGVKYRDIDKNGVVYGGPMYYLTKGFKELKLAGLGKFLAILFAILCVGGSLGGGNAFQSNQAAQQIVGITGIQHASAGFFVGV